MIKLKEKLSIGGTITNNDDCIGYGKNYIFTIDGATELTPVNVMQSYNSDAEWLSKKVSYYLNNNLENINLTIKAILEDAMIEIKKEYDDACSQKGLENINYPSVGICIFREYEEKIEVFRLGDVLGVIKKKNGDIILIQEKRLAELDEVAIKKQVSIAKEQNISVREAKHHINDILLKHRHLMNKTNGYFILEPKAEGIDKADYQIFEKNEIESISCMSDGFFCVVETYDCVSDYSTLHKILEEKGAEMLFNKMCKKQEEDKDFNKYPRFKMRDDASVVFANIQV